MLNIKNLFDMEITIAIIGAVTWILLGLILEELKRIRKNQKKI